MKFLQYLSEGVYDPSIFKAIFLAGGPGSGKSFVATKSTSGLGFKLVNSDILFTKMAKDANIDISNMKLDGPDAMIRNAVRDRAKNLTAKQMDRYVNGRLGLIIDGTGRDYSKIETQRTQLKKIGYDTYMIFVNTSLEVALERNEKRERTVDPKFVKQAWSDVQNNMGKFQTLFGSNYFRIVDNSVYKSDKNLFVDVWKEVIKFAKKPLKNNIAKTWIDQALSKKRR